MGEEKFSITKFFDFSPTAWYKVFGLAIKAFVFCLLILGVVWVKNFLFPPASDNIHKPVLIALPGSTVTSPNLSSEQKVEEKKRPWWMPIPYVMAEGAVRTRSSGGGIKFDDWEPEVRVGVGIRIDL